RRGGVPSPCAGPDAGSSLIGRARRASWSSWRAWWRLALTWPVSPTSLALTVAPRERRRTAEPTARRGRPLDSGLPRRGAHGAQGPPRSSNRRDDMTEPGAIYRRIGVEPIVNGATTMTYLGGSL